LVTVFNNPNLSAPPRNKKQRLKAAMLQRDDKSSISNPSNAEFIGLDPGGVNVATISGFDGSGGRPWVRSLRTKEYDLKSKNRVFKEQQKRRVARVNAELQDMSQFCVALRTPSPTEMTRYLRVVEENDERLWSVLGHKHVARGRLAAYVGMTRTLDAFLASLPVRKGRNVVIAYGAANFTPTSAGDRPPAPGGLMFKRCKLWAHRVIAVDEFCTTKKSFFGREDMEDVKGATRGLKCCRSSITLRLLAQDRLPLGTFYGGGDSGGVLLSRDGNAALNIRECIARGASRPRYLRRPTRRV